VKKVPFYLFTKKIPCPTQVWGRCNEEETVREKERKERKERKVNEDKRKEERERQDIPSMRPDIPNKNKIKLAVSRIADVLGFMMGFYCLQGTLEDNQRFDLCGAITTTIWVP
jgi:hypothetical protein